MKNKSFFSDFALTFGLIFISVILLLFPREATSAAKGAVELCIFKVIPSLFPFFVVSTLLCGSGTVIAFLSSLGNSNGAVVVPLILGAVGGYPIGAKSTAALYKRGGCTKSEAERLLLFCNNAGPAFILGFVGGGVFGSVKIGVIIYVIHIFSALCIGFAANLINPMKNKNAIGSPKAEHFSVGSFLGAVTSSVTSMLNISGFIVFFSVLCNCFKLCGVFSFFSSFFGIDNTLCEAFLSGLFEMTGGIAMLPISGESIIISASVASFLLSLGGLSVLCQISSVISECGLSMRSVLIGKVIQAVLASLLTVLYFSDFQSTSRMSIIISLASVVILITPGVILSIRKKHMEKAQKIIYNHFER